MHRGDIDPIRERVALDLREDLGLVASMEAARERVELAIANPASMIRLTGVRSDLARRPVRIFLVDEIDSYTDLPLAVTLESMPIDWQAGDVRANIAGPYARPGWASRCIDPVISLWETFRLSRRAARRQRGRIRSARRAARLAAA